MKNKESSIVITVVGNRRHDNYCTGCGRLLVIGIKERKYDGQTGELKEQVLEKHCSYCDETPAGRRWAVKLRDR